MVASFLSRMFLGAQARRRATARPAMKAFLAYESRTMLAGNVTASLLNGNLYLTGDSAANDLYITETSAGMIVRGVNGTKVNGATTDFVAYPSTATSHGTIVSSLGAGDDRFQLDNLTLDGDLIVVGGRGNDRLGLTQATIHGSVVFVGAAGNDTFYSEGSTIDGNLVADLGAGNDLLALKTTRVKQNVTVVGAGGADRVSLDAATVDHALVAIMGNGNDDIRLTNGTVVQHAHLITAGGSDLVQVIDSTISESFIANLGSGADNVVMSGTTSVTGLFIVLGGRNIDVIDAGTVTLPNPKYLYSISSGTVSPTLLTARIDSPTTGLLAAVQTARDTFFAPTAAVTTTLTGTGVLKTDTGFVSNTSTVGVKITGVAGQTLEIDRDGNGFNDGTVTLDSTGTATISVTLPNTNAANQGLNSIRVRQVFNGDQVGAIQTLSVQYTNTIVARMATTLGNIDLELFANDEPITTQNFVNYLARYADSIIHRSAHLTGNAPFIIQGGGFDLVPPLQAITTDGTIAIEFKAIHSNARGTISMAQLSGNINSGTSQWFFNTTDNNASGTVNLDSVPHTVFGQVLGTGMTIVDAIHALTSYNLIGPLNNTALGDVPLDASYVPFTDSLAGTVSVTTGTKTVTGVGTTFTTDLRSGAAVQIDGVSYTVNTVTSDTEFTIVENATATVTDGTAKVNVAPLDSQYVQITSVALIPQLV